MKIPQVSQWLKYVIHNLLITLLITSPDCEKHCASFPGRKPEKPADSNPGGCVEFVQKGHERTCL